jgi:ATP-binding cassette subfamily B protein
VSFPRGQTRSATGGAAAGGTRRMGGLGRDFTPVPKERRGRTIRRIVAFFRPYRLQVAVVLVAILATSIIGLANPYLLKLLIDDAIPNQDWFKLNLYVGLMIVLPVITGLIGVGQAYLNNVIGQNVMQDLRGALYSHLQAMPLRFFTATRTGEIQSRLANDVGGVQAVVTDTASSVTSNLAIAISTIVAMVLIDWRLTLLSLGLLPFFMYLTFRVG